MFALVRRDSIVRPLWRWLLMGLVAAQLALVLRCMAAFSATQAGGSVPGQLWPLITLWVPLAAYQLLAGLSPRLSRMDLGLPVAGPTLWSAHLLAYLLAGACILALTAGVGEAGCRLLGSLDSRVPMTAALSGNLPQALAVFALTGVLMNGRRLHLARMTPSGSYLAVDDSGRVVPSRGELPFLVDNPEWRARGSGPVLAVVMAVICGPALLVLAATLRLLRRRPGKRARKVVVWLGLGALLGLQLVVIIGEIAGWWDLWTSWSLARVLIRQAAVQIPLGALLLWVLAAFVLWGAYRAAEAQFRRVEASPRAEMDQKWWEPWHS